VLSVCAQRLSMISLWSAYRDERPPSDFKPLEYQTVSLPTEGSAFARIRFV